MPQNLLNLTFHPTVELMILPSPSKPKSAESHLLALFTPIYSSIPPPQVAFHPHHSAYCVFIKFPLPSLQSPEIISQAISCHPDAVDPVFLLEHYLPLASKASFSRVSPHSSLQSSFLTWYLNVGIPQDVRFLSHLLWSILTFHVLIPLSWLPSPLSVSSLVTQELSFRLRHLSMEIPQAPSFSRAHQVSVLHMLSSPSQSFREATESSLPSQPQPPMTKTC